MHLAPQIENNQRLSISEFHSKFVDTAPNLAMEDSEGTKSSVTKSFCGDKIYIRDNPGHTNSEIEAEQLIEQSLLTEDVSRTQVNLHELRLTGKNNEDLKVFQKLHEAAEESSKGKENFEVIFAENKCVPEDINKYMTLLSVKDPGAKRMEELRCI
eukprot:UN26241